MRKKQTNIARHGQFRTYGGPGQAYTGTVGVCAQNMNFMLFHGNCNVKSRCATYIIQEITELDVRTVRHKKNVFSETRWRIKNAMKSLWLTSWLVVDNLQIATTTLLNALLCSFLFRRLARQLRQTGQNTNAATNLNFEC